MTINIIIIVLFVAFLYFVGYKRIFPYCMAQQGKKFLYKKLFIDKEVKKKEILRNFHRITKNRFSDEEAIEFFMKEKGLQLMSITPGTPLKLKYYLSFPPKAGLTFFEKVKFNETFIKYRAGNIKSKSEKKRKMQAEKN